MSNAVVSSLSNKQHKTALYTVLILLFFAPSVGQYIAVFFQNYGIALVVRTIIHLAIPILFAILLLRHNIRQAALFPIAIRNKETLIWSIKSGLLAGAAAVSVIISAFLLFESILNFEAIKISLFENFGVGPQIYPLVAIAIILVNPFLEEYFWRGFLYRQFSLLTNRLLTRRLFMVLTGLGFAMHHVVIIGNWFNWWQFLLAIASLVAVGIFFNWMYTKSGSILAGWITHTMADLAIVLLGFYIFGFF